MTLRTRLIAVQDARGRRQRRLRQQLHRRAARCASASSPAATPTAIRARAGRQRRGTPVLVDGVRTRIVGRVSMDMITVDLDAGARRRRRQRGHAVGPRPTHGAVLPIDEVARGGRHGRLRADVRAGAARAGARRASADSDGCVTPPCPSRRRGRGRDSRRCARRAPAGRTSTRCRARCTCASTSPRRRCPSGEGAPARPRRPAHQRRRRRRHQGAAPPQPGAERATRWPLNALARAPKCRVRKPTRPTGPRAAPAREARACAPRSRPGAPRSSTDGATRPAGTLIASRTPSATNRLPKTRLIARRRAVAARRAGARRALRRRMLTTRSVKPSVAPMTRYLRQERLARRSGTAARRRA